MRRHGRMDGLRGHARDKCRSLPGCAHFRLALTLLATEPLQRLSHRDTKHAIMHAEDPTQLGIACTQWEAHVCACPHSRQDQGKDAEVRTPGQAFIISVKQRRWRLLAQAQRQTKQADLIGAQNACEAARPNRLEACLARCLCFWLAAQHAKQDSFLYLRRASVALLKAADASPALWPLQQPAALYGNHVRSASAPSTRHPCAKTSAWRTMQRTSDEAVQGAAAHAAGKLQEQLLSKDVVFEVGSFRR